MKQFTNENRVKTAKEITGFLLLLSFLPLFVLAATERNISILAIGEFLAFCGAILIYVTNKK